GTQQGQQIRRRRGLVEPGPPSRTSRTGRGALVYPPGVRDQPASPELTRAVKAGSVSRPPRETENGSRWSLRQLDVVVLLALRDLDDEAGRCLVRVLQRNPFLVSALQRDRNPVLPGRRPFGTVGLQQVRAILGRQSSGLLSVLRLGVERHGRLSQRFA